MEYSQQIPPKSPKVQIGSGRGVIKCPHCGNVFYPENWILKRRALVNRMRSEGKTFKQIGAQLGVSIGRARAIFEKSQPKGA